MPHDVKAMHPSGKLEITFKEEPHLYVDDWGVEYTSVTTLVHRAFPGFDAASAAEKKSLKTGIPAEKYIEEWARYGETCAAQGTRTHENCEQQFLGKFNEMHSPVDDDERARFRAAWYEVEEIKERYEVEPEKLVFSPRFRVAGSIDMFCRSSAGSGYAIGDWKFVKKLRREAFGNKRGTALATGIFPDCNYFHYALQLNIYRMILMVEGYIPYGAPVELFLKKYDLEKRSFDHVQLPLYPLEALLLLAYNATGDNLEYVPF